MILADRIREFVLQEHIEPTRNRGEVMVRVRAGEVHEAMKLNNRMPAVCSALDTEKFLKYAGVQLISRDGPHQGSNAVWVFEVK